MTKYQIDSTYDLYKIVKIIRKSPDPEVVLDFDDSAIIYKNSSNLMALRKIAQDSGKSVIFNVENQEYASYIGNMNAGLIDLDTSEIELGTFDSGPAASKGFSRPLMFLKPNLEFARFSAFRVGFGKGRIFKIVLVVVILIFLFAGGAWAFINYIPSASVKITLDSQVLVKLLDVKASVSAKAISVDTSMIPAFVISVTETDTQSVPTTGKKEIGEKATGKVTIINKTKEKKKIKKGTIIKQHDKDKPLKFVIDAEVEVPALEETLDSNNQVTGSTYGQKEVKVTAENFGTDYNLDKDQKFDIEGQKYDEIMAQNKDDLDGGAKTEINVVAQTDLDLLKKTGDEYMRAKVKESLNRKIVSGQFLPESSITYVVGKQEFSAKLDEDAKELSISMTYEGKGLAYDKSDLDKIVVELAQKVIPEDFNLSKTDPDYEAVGVKDTSVDGVLNIQVKLRSYIMPRIDKEQMKKDLSGMKLNEAQEYLGKIPNVQENIIEVKPQLPEFLLTMPKRADNISIEIEN